MILMITWMQNRKWAALASSYPLHPLKSRSAFFHSLQFFLHTEHLIP